MKSTQEPRNIMSHIIPQCYLRQFASKPDYVYVNDHKQKTDRELPIKEIGKTKNYFSYLDDNEIIHHDLEKLLATDFEGSYPDIVDKLECKNELSKKDLGLLFRFLASLTLRPTRIRESYERYALISSIETIKGECSVSPESLNEYYTSSYEFEDQKPTLEDFKKQVLNIDSNNLRWTKNTRNYHGSKLLLTSFFDTFDCLERLKRKFLFSEDIPFITCDHPFFIYTKNNDVDSLSLGLEGETLYFPLSSKVCLILGTEPEEFIENAEFINQMIVNASDRYIYHSGISIDGYIEKIKPIMRIFIKSIKTENGCIYKMFRK